ncbi:glucosamine-6-phosphate deaminase [Thecamonas trahens ATCC 50062]|uniref:Glucosamine-6-phosphate deaminase n=1 Tax=Thecamonas trahens ATCC 50062 TaxID=461836 RepID=A0A0L0DCX5_THETB|nr:glucosamine-6-phosphate deaminase [Thecamonas trahens ATCC 50062]KNC50187.1 glucosamine-6-phosphate deaminase [Thecamonas trahens ATCC 50062]|eukprot:XP_013757024.1 glucosamine-6-phosphate deaminase [Thecamonas trahens ATCC 50062]
MSTASPTSAFLQTPPKTSLLSNGHDDSSETEATPSPGTSALNRRPSEILAHGSEVEKMAMAKSGYPGFFDDERVPTIVVDNFPDLGKVTALRFIEWAQANPGGVVSLPTGKTPEYFIKWVTRILNGWGEPAVVEVLSEYGLEYGPEAKPDIGSLIFVQIDEFFPINPRQSNSFYSYVDLLYLRGMGFDPEKALLIDGSTICDMSVFDATEGVDLSLRFRAPCNEQERRQRDEIIKVDEWCNAHEARIRALGGIGFFLGGIGPDGHIAFNCSGADHFSTTRLSPINYETQAAAAGDLGGIEVSSKRLVITIGLGTITYNPECVAIIIAAGESKSSIVAKSLTQAATVALPATVLHSLDSARFYITEGAAKQLAKRELYRLASAETITMENVVEVLVDLCVSVHKELVQLTPSDVAASPRAALVLTRFAQQKDMSVDALLPRVAQQVFDLLVSRIEAGCRTYDSTRFLHTEPHHDDVMLGYMAGVMRQTSNPTNSHKFACMTSGFNSVTNKFMVEQLGIAERFIHTKEFAKLAAERSYFDPASEDGRNRDVWQYLDGVAAKSEPMKEQGIARRLIRNLIEIYSDTPDVASLSTRISVLLNYFSTQYDGQRNTPDVQMLKGKCREWEADCVWAWLGWETRDVFHARLQFYTANLFDEEPEVTRDVLPILDYLKEYEPDVVTMALDPENAQDTHYKVLQALTTALRLYKEARPAAQVSCIGYRNVWYRFHPSFSNMYIPVTLMDFAILESSFLNSYGSQRDASFPSYEHDGPFSDLTQQIQQDQYFILKTCLGRDWFQKHPEPLIRATRGFVFLKEMSLDEFYAQSRALKSATEKGPAAASASGAIVGDDAEALTPRKASSHNSLDLSHRL